MPSPGDDGPLTAALAEQHRLGTLGTSVEDAIEHSEQFLSWLPRASRVLDLGSGAGVPGLVLAWRRPDLRLVLLDVRQRRTDQLRRLVGRLGLVERVEVVCGTAAAVAAQPAYRGGFDAVVARSFGGPAEVVAASLGFLRPGGHLVVSEPPTAATRGDRWAEVLRAGPLVRRTPPGTPLFVAERFT